MIERALPSAARLLLALSTGAAVGALLTALGTVGSMLAEGGPDYAPGGLVFAGLFTTVFAFVVWMVGLLCIGLPLWAVCIRVGVQSWRAAVTLGCVLCFLCALPLGLGMIWPESWALLAGLSVAGGFVGATVWRVAYPRGSRA